MKDIIIPGRKVRLELFILLGCFALAICTNIFAILKFGRPAKELVTMAGYVVALAVAYYIILWVVRLAAAIIAWLVRKIGARR